MFKTIRLLLEKITAIFDGVYLTKSEGPSGIPESRTKRGVISFWSITTQSILSTIDDHRRNIIELSWFMIFRRKLNIHQIDRLSEITGNLGLVFFASLVVPIFVVESTIRISAVISGVALTLSCIMISLILLKGGAK